MVAMWKAAGGLAMSYTHVLASQQLNTGPTIYQEFPLPCAVHIEESNIQMNGKAQKCHYAGFS